MKSAQFVLVLQLAASSMASNLRRRDATEPPTPLPATAVVAGGGEGTCEWRVGSYSGCSSSCAGTMTREVFCTCTVSTSIVRATSDNCDRDAMFVKPISSRSCGVECPVATPPPTQPPRGGFGEGSAGVPAVKFCRWATGRFSSCSATCEGTRIRDVSCQCSVTNGARVVVSDNVCDREDPSQKPLAERSCGVECPQATPSLPPATREPRECNLTECRDDSDCYDGECCLQVNAKYSGNFFCFPLVQVNQFCDLEANWTCPCGAGLECRSNISSGQGTKNSYKKGKDVFSKFRVTIKRKKDDRCPILYKRGKLPNDHDAVCVPQTDVIGISPQSSSTSTPQTNSVPQQLRLGQTSQILSSDSRPIQSSNSCNLTMCRDSRDCGDDQCCLVVEFKEHKRKSMESFCFPFVDEGEACDQNGNWSCPCRDSLVCTSNSRSKGKGKGKEKNWRKYYMPEVVLEEEQECPTLYKAKRKDPDKYTPTCQKLASGRRGRASTYNEDGDKEPLVFVV